MRKIKTLKQAQKYLSKIDSIGEGGCGISALAMYQFIKSNNKIRHTKFVFLHNTMSRYLNNKRVINNGKVQAPSHCCLLYNGKFIDCDGDVEDIEDYRWIQVVDDEEFVIRAINNVGDWNSNFDRKYVVEIEKKLNVELDVDSEW